MKDILDLIGRILLAVVFFFEAVDSILYFNKTKEVMSKFGLTFQQDIILIFSIAILILGATLLLIGYRSSFGAVLLVLYWLPVTFIVHSFWNDPEEMRRLQSVLFTKSLAIAGGLFLMIVNGSGRYSVKSLLANTKVPKRFR